MRDLNFYSRISSFKFNSFGLDRLVAILGGQETIRDFIAFPKNNSGRDVMIDAPAFIDDDQLKELNLKLDILE